MFNRLTVNTLLKSVIAVLAAAVVVTLAIEAWGSWTRLTMATRIAAVTNASEELFKGLYNLRLDRTFSARDHVADRQFTEVNAAIKAARSAEMPALTSALSLLETIDFPGRPALLTDLAASIKALTALQAESAVALLKPKAERRAGLAADYSKETAALLDTLETASAKLTHLVKLEDAYVDQLLELKYLAWIVRDAGGAAATMVSNGLAGMPLPPDALVQYASILSRLDTAWMVIEDSAAGLKLPASFTEAVAKAKREFFAADHVDTRNKAIKAIATGQAAGITLEAWTTMSVARLRSLLSVAEVALEVAEQHAVHNRTQATWALGWQLALLSGALVLAIGMMMVVSRRVTAPLMTIQQAMIRLAGGDMTAQAAFPGRQDEIGKLAEAMRGFKDSMIETDRLRSEQKEAELRAAQEHEAEQMRASEERKEARERELAAQIATRRQLADDFQAAVGRIIETVSTAAGELESSAGTLTQTADTTLELTGVVASASEEASANVGAVASAAEEMTGSVNEIARQVQESSLIAGEAVEQAKATDVRINALSQAAGRIGDVVKLITAIAEQTNLLALNATIEAARAGEAGKGFAVVAQEVKQLAAQTAKATEEISSQIAGMQSATQESVGAIKEIGGTIGRISEIAAAIAAAVEEQGAATGEIARNVQQAARGTSQVADTIADVNRGASATGSASAQVLAAAKSLAGESGQLKSEVAKFLDTVRAA